MQRVLLHVGGRRRKVIDPREVYLLEAKGDDTVVRFRGSRRERDVRSLGELVPLFEPYSIVRIHTSYAVNLERLIEIRPRAGGRDWEAKLEPPVNRVLPVARGRIAALLAAYGDVRRE